MRISRAGGLNLCKMVQVRCVEEISGLRKGTFHRRQISIDRDLKTIRDCGYLNNPERESNARVYQNPVHCADIWCLLDVISDGVSIYI